MLALQLPTKFILNLKKIWSEWIWTLNPSRTSPTLYALSHGTPCADEINIAMLL